MLFNINNVQNYNILASLNLNKCFYNHDFWHSYKDITLCDRN